MIDREEIEAKAEEFEIHTSNVQRDYVFGWLLVGIYTASELKDRLVLKGGNCFRKAYFATTRFSADLDFSTESAIDPEHLLAKLNEVCAFVEDASGVDFVTERNRAGEKGDIDRRRKVYEARLYFKDFYGNPDTIIISVRLDVTEFDRIYLPVQTRNLIHPYSDHGECQAAIQCLQLEELLAIKLKCLLQRRHVADLFDYVYSIFINREMDVDRSEIVRVFLKLTIFEQSPGVVRGLLLDLPLEGLRAAWSRYIVAPVTSLFGFDRALEGFRATIEELFGSFAPTPYGAFAFFPANLRNPIMEAGASQTLLRLTYDGYDREVEPYSLRFKRRMDGVGREYFYAYDRTGGSSRPGIKAFVHDKIAAIQNTEEPFEPRWPIEISKAGEPTGSGYFARPFGGGGRRRRTPRRRRRTSPGMIYIVQCSYCGRKFRRKTRNTRMREHKDKYGNRCYGRTGFVVDQRWG